MALHVRIKTPKELPRETEIHGPVVPFYWNLAAFLISFSRIAAPELSDTHGLRRSIAMIVSQRETTVPTSWTLSAAMELSSQCAGDASTGGLVLDRSVVGVTPTRSRFRACSHAEREGIYK